MITGIVEVTQDPEQAGSTLKILSLRLRGMKGSLEEMGEEVDENVENISKMQGQILNLTNGKVNIFDGAGEFRSTYEIMRDISDVWDELNSKAQADLLETIAGKHRANSVAALLSNWQNVEEAVKAANGAEGSAARENAKYVESLQGRLDRLTTSWQSFANTFMNSDLLKGGVSALTTLVELVERLVKSLGSFGTVGLGAGLFGLFKNRRGFSFLFKELSTFGSLASDVWKSGGKLTTRFKDIGTAAGIAGSDIAGKFAGSLSATVGVIGLLVAGIGLAINAYKKHREETSKARQETIQASNEFLEAASSFEQAYIKYSGKTNLTAEEETELETAIKGTVDALGDKSSALQSVVNGSNDYLASLEAIKNAEREAAKKAAEDKKRDATLELKDLVKGWTGFDGSEVDIEIPTAESWATKIAEEMESEFLSERTVGASGYYGKEILVKGFKLSPDADVDEIIDYYYTLIEYQGKLEEAAESHPELLERDIYSKVKTTIEGMSEAIATYESGVYDVVKAQQEIPKTLDDYLKMREAILGDEEIANLSIDTKLTLSNSLDSEYAQLFDLSSAEAQARKFVGIINGYGEDITDGVNEVGTVETFLNMRTAVNNNECTVGQYLSELDNVKAMTVGWGDKEREEFNLAFGIDTDSIKSQYDDVYNYISRNYLNNLNTTGLTGFEISEYKNSELARIESLLNSLSVTELQAVANIKAEIDWSNASTDDILKQIKEEAKLIEALNFEANIEVDTTALELLNTALAESASAMGLSSESIDSLKAKYSELDGYNPSTLFERTANGVKLNREEVEKLEDEYNGLTKTEVQKHIDSLTEAYNDNVVAIDKCTNAGEKAQLIAKNETYKSKIEELATYQAQLEGVTGAYQEWIDAQAGPEDYDGYESIATGREDIESEIDRGFIGNKGKKYIDLLSGEDLSGKSVDAYAEAWEKLDDKVTGAGHSINDFFTVNDDGDITSTGIDRFFKSLRTDFEGSVAKFDEATGKWTYDFGTENLEKIQDEWGIGIEAIELLLEAAAAAGYDIDWDGILDGIDLDTSSFETLVSSAEAAQSALNEIEGFEDVDFNFTATGVQEATSELEKARSTYIDLITNDDGTINLEANGAAEMRVILATLLIQKQQLEDSTISINIDTSGLDESQQDIANAIEAVKTFREKYKNLEIAVTTGQGIEQAKTELNTAMTELQGLGDAGVDIAAELILGEGASAETLNSKVDAAISAVGNKDIKVGCKLDETAIGDLNSQVLANFTPEATVKITGIDDSLVNTYTSTEKTANGTVKWKNDETLVIQFQDKTHKASGIVDWANNVENVKTKFSASGTVTWTSGNNVKVNVISQANGTANANGTTGNSGRAFAHGNWGIKGSGTALVGELGMETLVRDGKFYTIGDSGAEFIKYRQGDIIFNHKQSEELFKNGKVTSNGGRGKMFANGSAFAEGGYQSSGKAFAWGATASESKWASNRNSNTGKTYGSNSKSSSKSSSSSSADDFEETLDLIEIAISRIEREIDILDQKANNVYKSWSSRNSALTKQISEVGDEIALQQKAYQEYMNAASGVGLSSSWQKKIKNGEIDIETIKDETLAEKIKDYQDYFEKAIACRDAIEELKETEASLFAQRLENVATQYEGILGVIEHEKNMLEEYISQSEAQGWLVSGEYYKALASNEQDTIAQLEKEKAAMLAELQTAIESGTIVEGSESWHQMIASIDEVTLAIAESETAILEYQKSIQELNFEVFDILQDKISDVAEEADFLIELLSSDKLYDDNGKLTNEGKATMGLHGQNYNVYMHQADTLADEIAKLDEEIARDPYDQDLINRRQELLELQQEAILNAQQEKEAIRDLVSEGIDAQLDALQKLIDKKNEALESERNLYEYQKKVKEQTEEIAALEKERAAYLGDTSESGKAKLQEIEVSLKEAKENLQETEYDKYISDQQQLLDELYLEYEAILNTRLDNLDALVESVVAEINADSTVIGDTIRETADSVGYTLSDSMKTIWAESSNGTNDVITVYGEKFSNAQTTTNNALNVINTNLQNMITQLNSIAKTNVKSASTSSASKSQEANKKKEEPKKDTSKKDDSKSSTIKVGGKINAKGAKIYDHKNDSTPERQLYRNDPVYKVLKTDGNWIQARWHKLSKGVTGWFKKGDVKAYATGKKNFANDEVAWTQENGMEEYIVRPSDGAILTPIARKGSVLNAQASDNLWNMTNSPAEFIKENLNLGSTNVPNSSNVQSNLVQHFENVTFSMPNVHGYNDLLKEMQRDPKFEKLILSMSIDRIAGGSKLAKGKSIRH